MPKNSFLIDDILEGGGGGGGGGSTRHQPSQHDTAADYRGYKKRALNAMSHAAAAATTAKLSPSLSPASSFTSTASADADTAVATSVPPSPELALLLTSLLQQMGQQASPAVNLYDESYAQQQQQQQQQMMLSSYYAKLIQSFASMANPQLIQPQQQQQQPMHQYESMLPTASSAKRARLTESGLYAATSHLHQYSGKSASVYKLDESKLKMSSGGGGGFSFSARPVAKLDRAATSGGGGNGVAASLASPPTSGDDCSAGSPVADTVSPLDALLKAGQQYVRGRWRLRLAVHGRGRVQACRRFH